MITANEQKDQMSQVRRGHQQRFGSARRTGHKSRQGGGGASERQTEWLAEGQSEEKETGMIA